MKIYTKTGDNGTTALFGGKRVSKSNERINAYGTVDELNSHIGLLRDLDENSSRQSFLLEVQDRLFVMGSMLAAEPGNDKIKIPLLSPDDVLNIEHAIDELDGKLPPMKHFILPGGHTSVSYCHIARCVCRRAERNVVGLFESEPGNEIIVNYLNRLSDYLFMLSRIIAQEMNVKETPWIAPK